MNCQGVAFVSQLYVYSDFGFGRCVWWYLAHRSLATYHLTGNCRPRSPPESSRYELLKFRRVQLEMLLYTLQDDIDEVH